MFSFKQYAVLISEEKTPARGIQHLPHPAEAAFQSNRGAVGSSLSKIQGVLSGRSPITRKIDDRMSFQVIKTPEGKVGVKYKGPGAKYNYSAADIKQQHGSKPYLVGPLMNILKHVHKVLPNKSAEYQGGYLSAPEDRVEEDDTIGHKPNTIKYSVSKNSPEGKKLQKSKVSLVIHSALDSEGRASPIEFKQFKEHPDVHLMSHSVSPEERKIDPAAKRKALEHIAAAKKLAKDHSHEHHQGHEETLLRYANSTIDTGEKPSVNGYKKFLQKYHQKRIDSVKTEKSKNQKKAEMDAAINHVNDNMEKFDRTFDIHHHIQQATHVTADALSKTAHGGYKHQIDSEETTGEGFVSNGVKFVPRKFTEANRKRSAAFKAQKSII
ncbi:MAG TPA: hypothetical protein DEB23_00130 [Chitinophagaceae bacterium]|nr:hypothetical protein [Chitinophagaceae bacterium]